MDLGRILVVDGDDDVRESLVSYLSATGRLVVQEAETGHAALETLTKTLHSGAPFDVVISDFNLRGMSGVQLCRSYRQIAGADDASFVILTAKLDESRSREAREAGIDAYLMKPVGLEDLSGIVDAFLRRSGRTVAGKFAGELPT
jgi:DNA-binding response OmpR family regulator